MKKRLLKKLYKRTEAENRALKYEVYHPIAIVRICIEERTVGTLVKDAMVEIDDDRIGLRRTIEGSVKRALNDWATAALENTKKREEILVGQMARMHEISTPPIIFQAPLAAHSMPGKECVEGCETLRLVKKALGEEDGDHA